MTDAAIANDNDQLASRVAREGGIHEGSRKGPRVFEARG